jgi:hypothetical protein
MLNISANDFRALLIDANLLEEDDKLTQQDVAKKMQEMKAFVEEMKVCSSQFTLIHVNRVGCEECIGSVAKGIFHFYDASRRPRRYSSV